MQLTSAAMFKSPPFNPDVRLLPSWAKKPLHQQAESRILGQTFFCRFSHVPLYYTDIVEPGGRPATTASASPAHPGCTGSPQIASANSAPRESSPTNSARRTAPPARGTTRHGGSAAGRQFNSMTIIWAIFWVILCSIFGLFLFLA